MRRVRQTIFEEVEGDAHDSDDADDAGGRVGNCLQAAVASVLGLELSEVPHFCAVGTDHDRQWWSALRRWGRDRGVDFCWVEDLRRVDWLGERSAALAIAIGPSPRGPYDHVVVTDADGTLVWDPHPSGDGLGGRPVAFAVVTRPYSPGPD